ncbi:MAG: MltA domain-containing protein [Pseudomonadota bacterium]
MSRNAPAQNLNLQPIEWQDLTGWQQDPLLDIWPGIVESMQWSNHAIENPNTINANDTHAIRTYLETYFQPHRINLDYPTPGLFTGYFEPEFQASYHQTDVFSVPIYRRPKNLILIEDLGIFRDEFTGTRIAGRQIGGDLQPYFTRKEIDLGALVGQGLEIAWLQNPIDAFFMSVQGSGRIQFADGKTMVLTYDAANGFPYTAIGQVLIQQGKIPKGAVTMQSIYQWFAEHPDQINEILWHNQSYIFFREIEEGYQIGASGMQLIPERSLAIDPAFIPFGTLLWVDIENPHHRKQRWQKLMLAQDKGSAIKGPVRGDVYWGKGAAAGKIAGQMQSIGSYDVVLPREK